MSYCKGSKAHRHSSFHRYVCALGLICWQVTSVLSAFSDSAKHCNLIDNLAQQLISNESRNFAAYIFSNLVIMEIASSGFFQENLQIFEKNLMPDIGFCKKEKTIQTEWL